MAYHKHPVEESFIMWISMHPESFHPLDMHRFYTFVHSVIRYNATSWHSFKKFQEKIWFHIPNFSQDNIEKFFNLMQLLINFSKASFLPLYDYYGYGKVTIRTVEKGEIIEKTED